MKNNALRILKHHGAKLLAPKHRLGVFAAVAQGKAR